MPSAIIQITALRMELRTEPVVRARSDWRFAKPGPGFKFIYCTVDGTVPNAKADPGRHQDGEDSQR